MQELTVWPTCYKEIYKAIIAPVSFNAFNERVQSVIATMAEFNLLEIIDGMVYQNHKDALPKDFLI